MAQEGAASNKSKPKLQKFNGATSKIKIDSWLNLFNVLATGLEVTADTPKVTLLMEYVEDEALQYYADEIAADIATITWTQVTDKMKKRFGERTIDPVLAASRRKWQRGTETVQQYYEEKMHLLRKTGLREASMAEVLTDGMPFGFRNPLIAAGVTTTSDWLNMAVRLESSFDSGPFRGDRPPPKAVAAMADGHPRQKKPFTKRQPPAACKICQSMGKTEMHWHSDCPNRKPRPQQNNNSVAAATNQDSLSGFESVNAVSLN